MSYLLASNSMKKISYFEDFARAFQVEVRLSSFVGERTTQQSKESEKQTEEGGQDFVCQHW